MSMLWHYNLPSEKAPYGAFLEVYRDLDRAVV
jgi:hypothetical protein